MTFASRLPQTPSLETIDDALGLYAEDNRLEITPHLRTIYEKIGALPPELRTRALGCLRANERLWHSGEDPGLTAIVQEILKARTIVGEKFDGVLTNLEVIFAHPPRVTVVGDREVNNLAALIHYSNHHPSALDLGGLVVPAHDVDDAVIETFDRIRCMRARGQAIAMTDTDAESGEDGVPENFRFIGPYTDASFLHVPYDAARLKAEGPAYRRAYCEQLLQALRSTHPDLLFLSNFKLILDRIVAEAFEGRIVNVHPSVLPHLKGWRTEHRAANLGEHPNFHGYTMHHVNTTLDGGATLLQQRVPFAPYNQDVAARMGQKQYETMREEVSRQSIILAQALFVGEVLGLVLSRTKRTTVNDADAFAVEDRPGFENNTGYIADLHTEYEEWKKHSGKDSVSYETWHAEHRPPYQRVLFDHDGSWQTTEAILGAPRVAALRDLEPRRRYTVKISGTNREAFEKWQTIYRHAQEGRRSDDRTDPQPRPVAGNAFYHAEDGVLYGMVDAFTDLETVLRNQGIDFTVENLSVRATAPRRQPAA